MEEKIPSLSLMVAKDTDKIEMAWIPGSDGKTPVDQIQYRIYLSTTENFTPGPSNLKNGYQRQSNRDCGAYQRYPLLWQGGGRLCLIIQ